MIKLCADANNSFLNTTMPFTDVSVTVLDNKVGFDAFEQIALIAFERTQVVVSTFND
ncbi:MAG: hypothetical protein F6J98_39445 [Moorea sp. SIO4G2]|uniref:hypothetical protein n=1 Tax=unclassified Moorena TaxID=2683338 RepID=UPI0013FB2ED2|nr:MULTISPECIES: hypothetical protein [unclassified Moorena]NEO11417.1 hypothetical protein [Moorena sp. SIO3E8]NEO66137.1 hypothetical protein [Moorena sp. SIO4G2]NEP99254.1 hypothetical protein [Moorena sp. SIO3F7]NEQ63555.1 hypothetical protein [Moorena sp. SIO4A1]